ncbi:MAG: hypothetical protein ACLPN1_08010 [Dissulfurispiraceae bacterium]
MKQQKKNKTIIVVARQAGTANAFIPLLEEIHERDFNVKTFAFAHAHKLFAENKISSTLIERFDNSTLSDVNEPSLLLTGTSEFSDEDNLFWQWARSKKIPSMAFVDSWVSYWQRFTPAENALNRFLYTPDFIAVLDQFMYDRMVQNGCDKKLLVITGSPAFDDLRDYVPKEKENIIRKHGDNYFLFIGEPFNSVTFGGSEKDTRGYTEMEVLALTAEVLKYIGQQQFKLVFRPHPRGGHSDDVHSLINRSSNIVLETGFTSRDLVACAKTVVGMTSMLLFEASVMGIPAISIQPNKKKSSDVIDYCSNIPVVISSQTKEVSREMIKILSAKSELKHTPKSTLSTAICRILDNQ